MQIAKKKIKTLHILLQNKNLYFKIYFKCLELSQIPAFVANSGASPKDNVKKKEICAL